MTVMAQRLVMATAMATATVPLTDSVSLAAEEVKVLLLSVAERQWD
jgi:hypothetical protein